MALPQQKRFSLDEAVEHIKHETGEPCTSNGLLELAKNNQIGISFHKQNWEYVRIDEASHEMENVHCKVLDIELVAPKDRRFVVGHASPYMGREESIFPLVNSTALKRINDDGDTSILSYNLMAVDEDKGIKVSIVESTRFPKEGEAEHDSFKMWLLTGYPMLFKRQNNSKPVDTSSYLKEGYYYKLKGSEGKLHPTVTINKKDFCIIRSALDAYIKRIQAEQNKPDRMQEAITEIEWKTGRTFTKNQLFRKAKEKKLCISFSKPSQALQYIQMDLPENEYDRLYCEPLHSSLIIPESRKALPEFQKVFKSVDESIYPILAGQSLIDITDLNKTETKTRAWNIPAKDKTGNDLEVTSFRRYMFGDANEFNIFKDWLDKHSLPEHFAQSIESIDETDYIIETGTVYLVDGIFIELDIRDLFIPPFALEQFIKTLLPESDNTHKIKIELPAPTDKEEKYFQKLTNNIKDQTNLIAKVIIDLGNPKKADIHTECHRINPDIFTNNFGTFKTHAWNHAYKSGRTIK